MSYFIIIRSVLQSCMGERAYRTRLVGHGWGGLCPKVSPYHNFKIPNFIVILYKLVQIKLIIIIISIRYPILIFSNFDRIFHFFFFNFFPTIQNLIPKKIFYQTSLNDQKNVGKFPFFFVTFFCDFRKI